MCRYVSLLVVAAIVSFISSFIVLLSLLSAARLLGDARFSRHVLIY